MSQHVEPMTPALGPPPRWSRRRKGLVTAAILAAVVLVCAAVVLVLSARRPVTVAPADTELPRKVGAAIEVTEGFRLRAGLETTAAAMAPLHPLVKVVGTATFDPTLTSAVGTRAPGVVTKVLRLEGDTVSEGELLAEIDSPELASVQADLRIALAKERAAKVNAARERGLLERGLSTAREHEEAMVALARETALAQAASERVEALGGAGGGLGISQLRAPLAGIVAERSIAPGQSVDRALIAFRVGDLSKLWVLLRVFERHLEHVRVGDDVDIRTLSDPERAIEGVVAHVGAVIDPVTRTADVRVVVDNEARRLRAGQAVQATIRASGPARVGLALPESAITHVDGAPTVFVAETPTRFVARRVELGIDAGEQVEVASGVAEGEQVVSENVLALKSELYR